MRLSLLSQRVYCTDISVSEVVVVSLTNQNLKINDFNCVDKCMLMLLSVTCYYVKQAIVSYVSFTLKEMKNQGTVK